MKGDKPKEVHCIMCWFLEEDNPFLPRSEGLQAGLAWDEIGTGTLPYLTWSDSLCQTEHLMEQAGAHPGGEAGRLCLSFVEWLFHGMEKGQPWHSHWLPVTRYTFPVTSPSSTVWSAHLFPNIGQGAQTPINHWKANASKSGRS